MRNRLYIVCVMEENNWKCVGAFVDAAKMQEMYDSLNASKLSLVWHVIEGVSIVSIANHPLFWDTAANRSPLHYDVLPARQRTVLDNLICKEVQIYLSKQESGDE